MNWSLSSKLSTTASPIQLVESILQKSVTVHSKKLLWLLLSKLRDETQKLTKVLKNRLLSVSRVWKITQRYWLMRMLTGIFITFSTKEWTTLSRFTALNNLKLWESFTVARIMVSYILHSVRTFGRITLEANQTHLSSSRSTTNSFSRL